MISGNLYSDLQSNACWELSPSPTPRPVFHIAEVANRQHYVLLVKCHIKIHKKRYTSSDFDSHLFRTFR